MFNIAPIKIKKSAFINNFPQLKKKIKIMSKQWFKNSSQVGKVGQKSDKITVAAAIYKNILDPVLTLL